MASQTSASASFQGLPASKTSRADRSLRRARIQAAARNNTAARSFGEVRRHPCQALVAASTAVSASAAPQDATDAITVDGLAGSLDVRRSSVIVRFPPITD